MKASDAIRAARALKKLKQHELAAAIGVSQQMVSEWETDREPVAMKNWPALKSVLDVDCAVLEMPQTTTTQTTTGNRSPAQQHTGSGNQAMYDRDGITCTFQMIEKNSPGQAVMLARAFFVPGTLGTPRSSAYRLSLLRKSLIFGRK